MDPELVRHRGGRKSRHPLRLVSSLCAAMLISSSALPEDRGEPEASPNRPENLAPKARASATSEHSRHYLAKFAIDGKVPACGGAADRGQAWCVDGANAGDRADFILEWDEPVDVAEIVYYGRTAWLAEECWKDYEVYLDGASRPAAGGQLRMGHGPQRIPVAPARVKRLTLRFLASHGGPNPGAAEIEVFAASPPEGSLPGFHPITPGRPAILPEESPELARLIAGENVGFERLLFIRRREINPSHVYTAYCEDFRPGGGISILSPPRPGGSVTELLETPEGQILDLDLSFDAREIVFSWKRNAGAGYHIFRMNSDGTGLRQLTEGEWHDYNACWLPDGGIAFVSTRAQVFVLCFTTPSGVLYRMDRDGGSVRRLSANYVNDFTPSVLADGRILYSRWEYVDRPAIPIQSLWTIHPDGTGLQVFFGNRILSPASFLDAKQVPGTHRVLCTLTSHNGPIRGAVGLIDASRGVNAPEAIANLTPAVDIGRADRGDGNGIRGPYETPNPIDERRFVVSIGGSLFLGEIGKGQALLQAISEGLGCYDGTVLTPRPAPPALAGQDAAAGAAARDGTAPAAGGEATVFLADVYRGLEPAVPRGAVRRLVVVEEVAKPLRTGASGFGFQHPVISCGATYAVKQVWGTVPVEEDGSACFKVPAGRPLYFIALDARGVAVQRMRSFTQFQPGEARSCIGCHEDRNAAPPAAGPPRPAPRPPRSLEPPPWGAIPFDFTALVQPALDRHCGSCHSGSDPQGGIDLSGDRTDWFNVSYEVLTRGLVNWIDTRNGNEANILDIAPYAWGSPASRLTPLLLSGHPDAEGHRRLDLDPESLSRILTWIDLNVPYYGTYEMDDESLPGGRRRYPEGLDGKLAEVWSRRCASCHGERFRKPDYVRITAPELNPFLLAPLAREAGGRGACRPAVYASKADPDYRAILELFEPIRASLADRPRLDMPGGRAAAASRSRL